MRHRRSSWVAVMLLGMAVLGTAHVEAARQFNGTSDSLQSASTIDLTGTQKVALSFWLWQTTFDATTRMAVETGVASLAGEFRVVITRAASNVAVDLIGAAGNDESTFPYPSAGVWHHYVINLDFSKSSSEIDSAYVDGVLQTLTPVAGFNSVHTFSNSTLNLMARNNASLWDAGRLAEVAIWTGILLSQSNVDSLYRDGLGAPATTVQPGSLHNYWPILGAASPEPATVGGINLTVNGTSQVAHPFGNTPGPRSRAPRLPGQDRRPRR